MKPKKTRTVMYLQECEKLLIEKNKSIYKLGYPLEDIVTSETIIDSVAVVWDEISQSWMCI